jgi:hypothetical protein
VALLDFTDKNTQVELNQDRLKEEYQRYHEIKSRIGIISIFYSVFAAYTVQLIKYAVTSEEIGWVYYSSLILFLLLFGISIFFAVRLLIPKEVAFKETPETFYKETFRQYSNNPNIQSGHVKYYIRETYLEQVEKAVDRNFKLNNRKSMFHYYAFTLALLAILPYLTCVGIKITKDPDDIQKIEITNEKLKIQIDSIINSKTKEVIMPEEESTSQEQSTPSNEEPTIDPSQVVHREPQMI